MMEQQLAVNGVKMVCCKKIIVKKRHRLQVTVGQIPRHSKVFSLINEEYKMKFAYVDISVPHKQVFGVLF